MSRNVVVSICCITYNHEKYIRSALESFVNQRYIENCEILIHDDASTDNTVSILMEYQKRYPEIIKVFTEEQNQYKLGKMQTICPMLFKKARGEYIAMCEGDDYWTDLNKLEKQVSFLSKHPEYAMCFHAARVYDCKLGGFLKHRKFMSKDGTVTTEQIIKGGGYMIPTASLFMRRESILNLPSFYYDCLVGDYPMQLVLSSRGRIYYMNQEMSVYRTNSVSSITNTYLADKDDICLFYMNIINMLKRYSKYTNGAYAAAINDRINYYKYLILYQKGDWKSIIRKPYFYYHIKETALRCKRFSIKIIRSVFYKNELDID